MKIQTIAPALAFAAILAGTTACATNGSVKKSTSALETQLAELKAKQEKTDAFITNNMRLAEALEVGRRVDAIEKKIADVQRQLEDFQTTWDSALREHKTTVENDVKTFERINGQRNSKSNQMMQTSIQKQIDALDALRADLQKIQSELRVLAPEAVGDASATQ